MPRGKARPAELRPATVAGKVDNRRDRGKVFPVPPAAHPSFAREVWDFLRVRKKWWLGPIVLVLVLFGALVVLTQGSAIAPFIYTIF
jgi:Family of unknown function (DUF5989)